MIDIKLKYFLRSVLPRMVQRGGGSAHPWSDLDNYHHGQFPCPDTIADALFFDLLLVSLGMIWLSPSNHHLSSEG